MVLGPDRGYEYMTTDYTKLLRGYPKYMSLEQMRVVCHISKKTARLLLQHGLVPYKSTGKKTHSYRIKKTSVFEYLVQRDLAPEKYILPGGSYARPADVADADYSTVAPIDFFLVEEYPDILTLPQAAVISRVTTDTVKTWAKNGYFKTFRKSGALYIPKVALLEYLKSPQHRRNYIWKQNNIEKRQKTAVVNSLQ